MTYLVSFNIIWVKGLLNSDWLCASPAASPIGPQLRDGETGKSSTPPPSNTIEIIGRLTLPRQNCHVTQQPTSQRRNCSTLQQILDKLLQTVYFIILFHIQYISTIIQKWYYY